MAPPVKHSSHGHDKDDNVDDHPREYVEAMETSYGEKEIRKIAGSYTSVCIGERIAAPPGALVIQVRPFPCLAAQESKASNDRPCQPFHYTFPVHVMAFVHSKHHGHRAHDQYEGHQAHKCKRQVGMTCKRKRIKYMVRVGPAIAGKTNGSIRNEES